MRAVLDANVLISAIIGSGPPAEILAAWRHGNVNVIVSERLLDELARTLARPKLARRIESDDAVAFVELLRDEASLVADPPAPRRISADPDDDYLIALAEACQAVLVSGDRDLLDLSAQLPIQTPRGFLALLEARP